VRIHAPFDPRRSGRNVTSGRGDGTYRLGLIVLIANSIAIGVSSGSTACSSRRSWKTRR
jgi:hypothetical protein